MLRRLPVFGVFGDGRYRLQPIYVDDLAELAVKHGEETSNMTIDANRPETFTYRGLVQDIGGIIGKPRPIVSVPPWLGRLAGAVIGRLVNDVLITREEIEGLMANLLYVDAPPAGKTRLTDWAKQHASELGVAYASELARRRDRTTQYSSPSVAVHRGQSGTGTPIPPKVAAGRRPLGRRAIRIGIAIVEIRDSAPISGGTFLGAAGPSTRRLRAEAGD